MRFKWLILLFGLYACKKGQTETSSEQFDIFLVAGQSNTLNGAGLIPGLDSSSEGIFQLGRHGAKNLEVMDAVEPLDHWDKRPGKIGFALTFAKLYKQAFISGNRKILLVPCGKGSSGFVNNEWNKTNPLYADAVQRVNHVIEKYPGSLLKAVLWHQGEHDVGYADFQVRLDQFVVDLRTDIMKWENPQIFIAGGMVPYWVKQDSARVKQQLAISSIRQRVSHTGYADPDFPTPIEKTDNTSDANHFDADGQREMGKRYFNEYVRLAK
jgi:hypothetical protein